MSNKQAQTASELAEDLIRIACSDNTLIALGVQGRELSWSHFMAWLMDPIARPSGMPEVILSEFLKVLANEPLFDDGSDEGALDKNVEKHVSKAKKLLRNSGFEICITDVSTEKTFGKAGRVDVVIDVVIDNHPLIMVVENKLFSEERERQLDGYFRHIEKSKGNSCCIIPVLIHLGYEQDPECSCTWAPVLNRTEISCWLSSCSMKLAEMGYSVHRLLNDYISVLKALDIADNLQSNHQDYIEQIKKENDYKWQLLKSWVSPSDQPFFAEVLESDPIKDILKNDEFADPKTFGMLGRSEGMKIYKSKWILYPQESINGSVDTGKGICVHFESRKKGRLQLHAEIHPYEGLRNKPERRKKLKHQLEFKEPLLQELRDKLLALPDAEKKLGANINSLHKTIGPSTGSAINFDLKNGDKTSVEDCAKFFSTVIQSVVDTVDRIVQKHADAHGFRN